VSSRAAASRCWLRTTQPAAGSAAAAHSGRRCRTAGKLLLYGSRDRGRTGLRLLNLENTRDRWLLYPVQQDELQASGWRDLLPRHEFTPDDRAVIANLGGRIVRIDLASGAQTEIPFRVREELPIGPSTRQILRQETGPVTRAHHSNTCPVAGRPLAGLLGPRLRLPH